MLTSILLVAATLPFAQPWSDTGLISRDDDWAGVAGVVGYRGDGLTAAAGADPRAVVGDGSGTPVDVNANERDPGAVGLPAGVTEFELPDPVVALQGSATAAAPHLVVSVDTAGRSGVTVRYRLRDLDPSSIANAVQPVALQYRVGDAGDFAPVPGGFVADATTGPGQATLVTPVSAVLPAAADDRPLVQLRILTANAVGQDEWVGVDDIEVEASGSVCPPPSGTPPGGTPPGAAPPALPPQGTPPPPPAGTPPPGPPLRPAPQRPPLDLTDLTISPALFKPARQGAAVTRAGRAGASLRFRLSRAAKVDFRVASPRLQGPPATRTGGHGPAAPGVRRPQPARAVSGGASAPRGSMPRTQRPYLARAPLVYREIGRFSARGRRGINRFRFTGRLRGRALPAGSYRLTAYAIDSDSFASAPADAGFRIRATDRPARRVRARRD